MRKLNDTSKICTFLCIVLCVGSLSGCGAAMQFLADGTDAVLNGLADGTNNLTAAQRQKKSRWGQFVSIGFY